MPCASKLDQAFPSVASRDFLGAWLVPKCAHSRGGSIWQVEIAALRGWTGSHDRRVPTARALLAGYNPNTSPSTHCSSYILEVLLRAGFVPSTPGTPELCSSAYTLQVALCAQSAIRNLSNACRSIVDGSVGTVTCRIQGLGAININRGN